MKIQLTFADRVPTAQGSQVMALGGERTSPLSIPELGATAKAIDFAGKVAIDINERMVQAQRVREATQAMTDMTEGFNNIYDDIKTNRTFIEGKKLDPNYNGPNYANMTIKQHEELFERRTRELKNSVLGKMEDYRTKEAFNVKFDKDASNELIKVQNVAWNREIDRGRQATKIALVELTNDFATNGNGESLASGDAVIEGAVATGIYSKTEGEVLKEQFSKEAFLGYYDGQITRDPAGTRMRLFKEGVDEAGNLVLKNKDDLPESFKTADEAEKNKVINAAASAWNQAKGQYAADFENKMKDLTNAYIQTDDPELKKKIKTEMNDTVEVNSKLGIIRKQDGPKLLREFNNNAVDSTWRGKTDADPLNTFDTAFRPLTAEEAKDAKKGFYVSGKEGRFVERRQSDLTKEWGSMDEERKRQLLLYIRQGYESWYRDYSWGLEKSKLIFADDVKNDYARREQTGNGDPDLMVKGAAAYANDPAGWEQRKEIIKRDQALADTTFKYSKKIVEATPFETAEILTGLKDYYAAGPGTRDRNNPYAADPDLSPWRREKLISDLESVVAKKAAALQKDPYAFVNTYIDTDKKSTMPFDVRVKTNILDQQRQGVPAGNIRAMGVTEAKYQVAQFGEMSGEDIVKTVDQMKLSYGESFGMVMKDLQAEKLPPEIAVVAALDPMADSVLRHQVAEVSKLKEPELLKNAQTVDPDLKTEQINTRLGNEMVMFQDMVLRGNPSAARMEQLDGIKMALRKTVMLNVSRGMKYKDATDLAIQGFITSKYSEVDIGSDTTLIPNNIKPAPQVAANWLAKTQREIDKRNIILPPDRPAGVDENKFRERINNDIRNRGFWALNRNMTGMILYGGWNGLPLLERVGDTVKPVEVLFDNMSMATPEEMERPINLRMGGIG